MAYYDKYPPDFRDHLIAASLKLAGRGRGMRRYLHFRDHLIAASLKPVDFILRFAERLISAII